MSLNVVSYVSAFVFKAHTSKCIYFIFYVTKLGITEMVHFVTQALFGECLLVTLAHI